MESGSALLCKTPGMKFLAREKIAITLSSDYMMMGTMDRETTWQLMIPESKEPLASIHINNFRHTESTGEMDVYTFYTALNVKDPQFGEAQFINQVKQNFTFNGYTLGTGGSQEHVTRFTNGGFKSNRRKQRCKKNDKGGDSFQQMGGETNKFVLYLSKDGKSGRSRRWRATKRTRTAGLTLELCAPRALEAESIADTTSRTAQNQQRRWW